MATLFGIDIAGIVHTATRGQLFAGSLVRKQQTRIQNFTFEGVPASEEDFQNVQSLSVSGQSEILIIANSITPTTKPRVRDELHINETDYTILRVQPDPAEATYLCLVSAN